MPTPVYPAIEDDEVPLINAALGMIGSEPIGALDDDTELNETVQQHWPRARNHCLGIHGWRFNRKTVALDRESATPTNGWAYQFTLPNDVQALEAVLQGYANATPPLGNPHALERLYDQQENKIFSNCQQLYARFRFRAAVSVWPELFKNAVMTLGAAYFAVPVMHDRDLANSYRQEAVGDDREAGKGGILGRAIAEDRAERPAFSPLLAWDPLTSARYE